MRILIVRNNYNPKALESALLLEVYLASQGVEFTAFDTDDLRASSEFFQRRVENIDDFDLAVVLGGDGTILRTAAQIKYRRIPILGVNFGHLGFMANSNEDGIIPVVAAALAGELTTCAYTVAGEKVADVKGDGLIVATATGSTAYALSAGGPLVAPGYSGLVVVPIAPHSLHSRALVTGPSDIVEIAMDPSSANREATMFIDGELIPIDRPIRRVIVQSGEEPTVLLRYKAESFYGRTSRVFFS